VYEFGPFRLDPIDRLLWRQHDIVQLPPKAIDMLLLFVESGGRVLSKEDLMARLWPDTFVEEANLSHQVYKLRDALGSDATYIETIARRGYRFAAPVKRRVEAGPMPVVERDLAVAGVPATASAVIAFPAPPPTPQVERPKPQHAWRHFLGWAAAAVLAVALVWRWQTAPPQAPSGQVHLTIELGEPVVPFVGPSVVLSPDGSTVAFRARSHADGRLQIFVRRLNQNAAAPLQGTEGVEEFFFSPGGDWIGFSSEEKLKKIPTSGGDVITLADVGLFRGGAWTLDGYIVFARSSRGALTKIPDSGGEAHEFSTLDNAAGEVTHRYPQALPDGKTIIFTAHSNSVNYDDATIMAKSLSGGPPKPILRGGFAARYVESGHLLYVRTGTLFAVSFDLKRLATVGKPVPLVERLVGNFGSAGAQFSVSTNGTLVYLQGTGVAFSAPLVLVDASGHRQVLREPAAYLAPRFSPDGRRLAFQIAEGGRSKIWVYDLERQVMSRLTNSRDADEGLPIWTPDGLRIIFSSDSDERGKPHLFWKKVDGSDSPIRLTDAPRSEWENPGGLLADGKTLVFGGLNERAGTYGDILKVRVDAPPEAGRLPAPVPLLNASYGEGSPAVSPNGRWLAYVSSETGRGEVYVRRLPGLDGREQVSFDGGQLPTWSLSTNELFFRSDSRIMVVTYARDGTSFLGSKPREWGKVKLVTRGAGRTFDVHPDGKRVVIVEPTEGQGDRTVNQAMIRFGFFDELRRMASGR
jgi:serine/threonine-protein kinase